MIVAKFVYFEQPRLNKVTLGEQLGRDDVLWREVLEQYLTTLAFKERDVLQALRLMISKFRLPGEGQVRSFVVAVDIADDWFANR